MCTFPYMALGITLLWKTIDTFIATFIKTASHPAFRATTTKNAGEILEGL